MKFSLYTPSTVAKDNWAVKVECRYPEITYTPEAALEFAKELESLAQTAKSRNESPVTVDEALWALRNLYVASDHDGFLKAAH